MGPADDVAIGWLRGYLADASIHGRSWIIESATLVQRIKVDLDHWVKRFEGVDLPNGVRSGIDRALNDIGANKKYVDRALLTGYARTAGTSTEALVACWFAVMAWGAGPQNRSRLRQWTRAIPSAGFAEVLAASRTALLDGRHADAYKTTRALPGVGEAYLTKWLWVLGLAGNVPDPQPYILDNYVWQSLNRLGWTPNGRNNAERWVDFCRTLERWSRKLGEQEPTWHIDGDRVEQLLFDRGKGGVHFFAWLGDQLTT